MLGFRVARRVCKLYLLLAFALGSVVPFLPLAQVSVYVYVYILITVVVLLSLGIDFAKASFAVSCKLCIWKDAFREQTGELDAVAAKYVDKSQR